MSDDSFDPKESHVDDQGLVDVSNAQRDEAREILNNAFKEMFPEAESYINVAIRRRNRGKLYFKQTLSDAQLDLVARWSGAIDKAELAIQVKHRRYIDPGVIEYLLVDDDAGRDSDDQVYVDALTPISAEAPPSPPTVGWTIVVWLTPRERQEEILGDLDERYLAYWTARGPKAAKAWYWGEVAKMVGPFGWRAIKLFFKVNVITKLIGGL